MKKVIITNLVTNEIWRNLEIEDPTEWIASCIDNDSWGKKAHSVLKSDGYPEVLYIDEYEDDGKTYVNLKDEYVINIDDITFEYDLKTKIERKISTGKAIQDASEKLIQLITGDNMESGRTAAEISQMQTDFAEINALITAGRLITAKTLIQAINNDTYAELKSDILALYSMSGF